MLLKNKIKALYDDELKKQTDAYSYYIENVKDAVIAGNTDNNEGEHENVPFICMNGEDIKFVCEDEHVRTYEYADYFIYESKKGISSTEEKAELVTNAIKLNADLIYSDVDCITCYGKRAFPFYKPEYSVDTARCFDYFTDFYAVKKSKSRMELELLENIAHVSKPLFHYILENNNSNPNEIYKLNNRSYLTDGFYLESGETDDVKDRISIIIPSKDNPGLLRTCLLGIAKAKIKSRINTLEVVVVDNGSVDNNKSIITSDIERINAENSGLTVKYLYEKSDFNFSLMCNKGADESSGDYFLFLNDDIEITDELFLLKLVYFAKMDHVGACGVKLLYPGDERRIQHIGITSLKLAGPTHKLSTFRDSETLYFGRNRGIHNCLAVTGACLMVSREKYFKTGGFHDKMKVGYNDVDLCVSLYEQGFLNVVNNECILIHHESVTRGHDAASFDKLDRLDKERNILYERHPWLLSDIDPYYNVNLAEDFLEYRVNVIPDFEKRDYESKQDWKAAKFVARKDKGSDKEIKDKPLFYNLEKVNIEREYVSLSGWALINKKDNYLFDTYLGVRAADDSWHVFNTAKVFREDLAKVFKEARFTGLSGFFARIPKQFISIAGLNDDKQRFALILKNKQTGKRYYAGFTKSDI